MYSQNHPDHVRQKLTTISPMLPRTNFTVPNSTNRHSTDPSSSYQGSFPGENPNDSYSLKKSQFYPGLDETDIVEMDGEKPQRSSYNPSLHVRRSHDPGYRAVSRSLDRPIEHKSPLLSSYGPDSANRFNANSSFMSTERPTSRAPDVLPMFSMKAKLARDTLLSRGSPGLLPPIDPLLSQSLPPENPHDNFYNPQYGLNQTQLSSSWIPTTHNSQLGGFNYGYNPQPAAWDEPRSSVKRVQSRASPERVTILPEVNTNNDILKLQTRRIHVEHQSALMDQIVEKQRQKEEELRKKKIEDELDALRIKREAIEQMYQLGSEKHQKRLLLESHKINGSAPTLATVGKLTLRDIREEERLKKLREEEEALLKRIAYEYGGVYSRFGHHIVGMRKILEMKEIDLKNELLMAKYNLMDAMKERNRQKRDIEMFKHKVLGDKALVEYERRRFHEALLGEPRLQRPVETLYFRPDLNDRTDNIEDPTFVFPKRVGRLNLDVFRNNHDEQVVGRRQEKDDIGPEQIPAKMMIGNSVLFPPKRPPEDYKHLPTVQQYGTDDPLLLASRISKSELSPEKKTKSNGLIGYSPDRLKSSSSKKSVTFAPVDLRNRDDEENVTNLIRKNDRLLKTLDEMELRELMVDRDLL